MQIPMEAKIDSNGLFYINDNYVDKYPDRLIKVDSSDIPNNYFYELITSSDYALKYNIMPFNKDGMINMLLHFQKLQEKIRNIDFPIGYYVENDEIYGEIIRFYKNAPSLKTFTNTQDINELSRYYYHDDDNIHNLYLIMLDILNLIEELFENNVFYTDIHTGNFVLYHNQVKIIDFDYQFVHFNNKKSLELMKMILFNYGSLVYVLNKKFNIGDYGLDKINCFQEARTLVKKMENMARKRV